jgi:hypothetical protein
MHGSSEEYVDLAERGSAPKDLDEGVGGLLVDGIHSSAFARLVRYLITIEALSPELGRSYPLQPIEYGPIAIAR